MSLKKLSSALLIAVVAAMLTTGATAQTTLGKTAKKRNDLTGTWLVNIEFNFGADAAGSASGSKFRRMARTIPQASQPATLAQAPVDAPTQAPFNTLITFHSEGTFAENSQLDYAPPPGAPGRGAWERIGEGEFSATLYGILLNSFDNPELAGTYRERIRLKTNEAGDQFTGTTLVEVYDSAGNLILSFDGMCQGQRATVAPAP